MPKPQRKEEILKSELPPALPLMALRSTIVYPLGTIAVQMGAPENLALLRANEEPGLIVALVVASGDHDEPIDSKQFIGRVGVAARVHERINLPGDTVQMSARRLILNGQPVAYRFEGLAADAADGALEMTLEEALGSRAHRIQWSSDRRVAADFGPIVIPPDQYLMLGDNRDNSADSRFIGLVQRKLLIGRAERILVSAAILDHWRLRLSRFGAPLQ